MAITINSSASDTDFTTLETVKEELGISSTDDDSLLADLIMQAGDEIRYETGRKFAKETVTETITGDGGTRLVLARVPLKSIAFIEDDGSSVASTSYEIEDAEAGFVFRENGWTDGRQIARGITHQRPTRHGSFNIEVKYTAGYAMPGSTGRDLPHDLERAAVDLVKQSYLRRRGDPSATQEIIGAAQLQRETGRPESVNRTLVRWARLD